MADWTKYKDLLLQYTIGEVNVAVWFILVMILTNLAIAFLKTKQYRISLRDSLSKLLSYFAFVLIANIMDTIVTINVQQWEVPTRILVLLFLVGREATILYKFASAQSGISVPIIEERIKQWYGGDQQGGIDALNEELKTLKEDSTKPNTNVSDGNTKE